MSRETSAGSLIRVVKVRVMREEKGTIRMKGKQVAAIGDESCQWRWEVSRLGVTLRD